MKKKEKGTSYFDYSLLFIVLFTVCFGLIVLYSASYYEAKLNNQSSYYYVFKQIQGIGIGLVLMAIMIKVIDYHFYGQEAIAIGLYVIGLAMTVLVMTPLGYGANGARRWLNLGMSIQVCEVVKIIAIIDMAALINAFSKKLKYLRVYVVCILIIGVQAGAIIGITSDLSSGIVIGAIGFIMLFVACNNKWYSVGTFIIAATLAVGMVMAKGYRMKRVRAWLNPEKYKDGDGYQILQSLYSVCSGNWFGKGLGKGIQKLGYIPETQNDMIFTVICEELGILGGIAVILIFIFMIYRFLVIANNAPDLFGAMLVIGVMAHISVQTLLNIAVVTNVMPNTGVTLPFISYGGTSIMCLLIEIGLVLSVSKRIRYD